MKKNIFQPLLLLIIMAMLFAPALSAGVPEPDNILYGSITLGNQPVTAEHKNIVVEARRSASGPAIARYRMGDNAQFGNFYSLRISLESATPLLDLDASLTGDNLFIVVLDAGGVRQQATFKVANRATVQRLDLGGAVLETDSDNDGLLDAWEILNFGNLNQSPTGLNLNGRTALQNYVAGTDPNDTNSVFSVNVSVAASIRRITFAALRAEGAGYEGLNRYYSLEFSTNAGISEWLGVPNFTNLVGNNQTITYEAPFSAAPVFYRGVVRLQAP